MANNVANVDTNGYKRRSTVFQEYLMPNARQDEFQGRDQRLSYAGTRAPPSPGARATSNAPATRSTWRSRAIQCSPCADPAANATTRNGSLGINAKGELVNSDGHVMVTDQGALTISSTETDIKIAQDGSISTSNGPRGN